MLEDETGRVLVDTAGASPYLQTTTTIEVDPDESPPMPVGQFLQSTEEIDGEHTRTRRYVESRLDPGDDVHVFGPVRKTNPSVDLPQTVDGVIGVKTPGRGITIGEDSLATILDKLTSTGEQFIVTNGGERGAERQMLKIGALLLGVGLLFLSVSGLVMG